MLAAPHDPRHQSVGVFILFNLQPTTQRHSSVPSSSSSSSSLLLHVDCVCVCVGAARQALAQDQYDDGATPLLWKRTNCHCARATCRLFVGCPSACPAGSRSRPHHRRSVNLAVLLAASTSPACDEGPGHAAPVSRTELQSAAYRRHTQSGFGSRAWSAASYGRRGFTVESERCST